MLAQSPSQLCMDQMAMLIKVCFCLLLQKTTTWKALEQGRLLYFYYILKA